MYKCNSCGVYKMKDAPEGGFDIAFYPDVGIDLCAKCRRQQLNDKAIKAALFNQNNFYDSKK